MRWMTVATLLLSVAAPGRAADPTKRPNVPFLMSTENRIDDPEYAAVREELSVMAKKHAPGGSK